MMCCDWSIYIYCIIHYVHVMTCIDVHLHVSVVALSKFKVLFIHLSLSLSCYLSIWCLCVCVDCFNNFNCTSHTPLRFRWSKVQGCGGELSAQLHLNPLLFCCWPYWVFPQPTAPHHVGFHAKQTQVARVWDIPNMHHQKYCLRNEPYNLRPFYQNGWTGSQSSSNQLVNWIRQLTWVHSLISLLSRPSRTALDTREDFVTLCHVTRSWISEICTGTFPPLLLTAA